MCPAYLVPVRVAKVKDEDGNLCSSPESQQAKMVQALHKGAQHPKHI